MGVNRKMSITIHYQGKAKSLKSIDELIETFQEFAAVSQWQYHIIDDIAKGIQIEFDPRSEWLEFIFDPQNLQFAKYRKYGDAPGIILGHGWFHCKTQFGGPKAHIIACKLLKAAEKYIELSVEDEGKYYQSQDLNALNQAFGESTQFLESLKKMFEELEKTGKYRLLLGKPDGL
jgi:hypothetical protein